MTAPASAGTVAAAAAARAVQLMLRAQLMRDVARLWPTLDPKRLPETFPGWLAAMQTLVTSYHGQSSVAAGRAYAQARAVAIETPTTDSLIRLAPTPSRDWMTQAFGYAGPGMLSKDTARPGTALTTTLGTAARVALDGGRTTIAATAAADPVAVGWYRVTDSRPCAFCALMASRGIAYANEYTAGRAANRRFTGHGEFKFHNDCGCTIAPAFSHDAELPELSQRAAQVYRERGKGDALAAFRKAWAEHLAASA